MDSKELQNLNEVHEKYVDGLKKSLFMGQAGFLVAGHYLLNIKEKKTYLAEDSSEETTWTDFLSRPDLPFPGRTPGSKIRTAQMLMQVYKFYVKEKQLKREQLSKIGYSKLDMLIPVIKAKPEEQEDWLEKASELTSVELMQEISHKDKNLGDLLSCKHENVSKVTYWRCNGCGDRFPEDPHKKDGK